jgi:hypothetical protein
MQNNFMIQGGRGVFPININDVPNRVGRMRKGYNFQFGSVSVYLPYLKVSEQAKGYMLKYGQSHCLKSSLHTKEQKLDTF